MTKYTINLITYSNEFTAEAVISKAIGCGHILSKETILFLFGEDGWSKNGIFKSKKLAEKVADKINKRGAFGGFSICTMAIVNAK